MACLFVLHIYWPLIKYQHATSTTTKPPSGPRYSEPIDDRLEQLIEQMRVFQRLVGRLPNIHFKSYLTRRIALLQWATQRPPSKSKPAVQEHA